MGFTEVLTVVFIVLKLTHVIAWSWWLVLLPELIAIGFFGLFVTFAFIAAVFTGRKIRMRLWPRW